MKKIILSLAIIGVVAGISLGITGALFTANQPIGDNKFQAGTLKIKQGENDLPVTFANLMPGVATEPQKLTIGNDGSLDAVIDRIFVSAWENWGQSNISASDFAKKLNITITDEIGRPLWKGTLYDLGAGTYPDGHGNAIDGTDRVFLGESDIRGTHKTDSRDYWFTFELDPSVSDPSWQGADIKATFTVNATQVKDNKFDAGERLLDTQNNDGGWEGNNPDTDPATGVNPKSNIVGVTAMGLLRAYEFSGNSDYFDAAEKSAYEIANHWCTDYTGDKTSCDTARTSWKGGGAYTNPDILFLQRMGKYYNTPNLFSTKAEQAVIDRWNAYNNDAQEVYEFIKGVRANSDVFYWDLAPIMEYTVDAANTVSNSNQAMVLRNNALKLAKLVAADQNPTGGWFITSWNNVYAQLGQASAIRILQLADDMSLDVDYSTEISDGVTALLTQQNGDGSFRYGTKTDGKNIQTTAYATLVLEMAGHHTEAQSAVDNLISQQLSNGSWNHIEPDDYGPSPTYAEGEYPEVNSEALRAIVSVNQ